MFQPKEVSMGVENNKEYEYLERWNCEVFYIFFLYTVKLSYTYSTEECLLLLLFSLICLFLKFLKSPLRATEMWRPRCKQVHFSKN